MQSKELKWISEHPKVMDKYGGKWIAIWEDKIIAVGESLHEVNLEVNKRNLAGKALINQVPREDEEILIL